ncbi:hypothetical protein IIC65_07115 [Candidatus Sumerlaeota bacterium]|nr:hypothetical protein [Candidatus Sumerlaeota bacterium]
MPLKFWNQQAHFTTPAGGTPEKAIRGLASAGKILKRFGITPEEIAERTGAPLATLLEFLNGEDQYSPFVMVDVEDAVALTEESIDRARLGAVRVFTQEDWGRALPFYRPGGLKLEGCVDDMLTVLPEVAKGREPRDYPIAGIVWPKSEHPDEIAWVCDVLAEIEKKIGLEENQIKLELLIESGYALAQAVAMTSVCAHRLVGIIWGIADYSADTNLPAIRNDHPVCDWARFEIVNIAGALNVPAIDNMTLNYPTPIYRGKDLTSEQTLANKEKVLGALQEVYDDAVHGMQLGMSGKWAGHPAQLLMVMLAYRGAIPAEKIQEDLREIEAYGQSVAAGAGATMLGDGHQAYMADRATDRHLRARLRRATAWGSLPPGKALELGLITEAEHRQLGTKSEG